MVEDLVPYHLERIGVGEAIRETLERVSASSAFSVTSSGLEIPVDLPVATQLSLFRVIQEALNNVVKHAAASTVDVSLVMDSDRVRVTIRDDGRGFDRTTTPLSPARGGFGLVGMSERARMLGGMVTVESSPGRGTEIRISVPRPLQEPPQ